MLCRVAENVFWMSRYMERAHMVVRLIDVTRHLELDLGDGMDEYSLWQPLLGRQFEERIAARIELGEGYTPTADDVRTYLAFDYSNPDSLISCIHRAREAARGVRESISSEIWEQINTLYLSLASPRLAAEAEADPHGFYKRVREGIQFFEGLVDCTLARDEPWQFVSLGKYLERAYNVAQLLHVQAHLLTQPGGGDTVRWLAVLRSCGSVEAYARYYSLRVEPARVLEFLLLNPVFPQSVRFSLRAAWDALQQIAGPPTNAAENASLAMRAMGLLSARLEHAAVDEVIEESLDRYLDDVQARITAVSDLVTHQFLRYEPQPGRLMAATRAAMIMAAQQQQ